MDFVQGTITTLHDLTDDGTWEVDRPFAAIVPMNGRELGRSNAESVVRAALNAGATRVVVPVRAPGSTAVRMAAWLSNIDQDVEVIWCNAPTMGPAVDPLPVTPKGKGGDVWLALGPAARGVEHVCLFDADVTGVSPTSFRRLVSPLGGEVRFSKAFYARVEDGRFYGRLFRLLYRPLVTAMRSTQRDPLLAYLESFRYALSGEFAVDAETALGWSLPVGMGLEVATLGEAFDRAGPDGSVQVDLGVHRHHHRDVTGEGGLEAIAPEVVGALERVIERNAEDAAALPTPEAYRLAAHAHIDRYRRDARFNGLRYDRSGERAQVDRYARAVADPETGPWLPPWSAVDLEPETIVEASEAALQVRADASGNT